MKSMKSIIPFALVAISALVAYPLFAHCGKCAVDGKAIATRLNEKKKTLVDAITAAEMHSKGRAIAVTSDLDDEKKLAVLVYCIAVETSKIMQCHYCYEAGSVIGMKEVKEYPITATAAGDGHASVKTITNQTVGAACGVCIYKMPGITGCPLAVAIDGKHYLVEGATWPNHDYCERHCEALVSGRIEGGTFIATHLKPTK